MSEKPTILENKSLEDFVSEEAIQVFSPIEAKKQELIAMAQKTSKIVSIDHTDKSAIQEVHDYRMKLKSTRVHIKKQGKAMRDGAIKYQKWVIGIERELIDQIEPEEKRLEMLQDEAEKKRELDLAKKRLPSVKEALSRPYQHMESPFMYIGVSDDALIVMSKDEHKALNATIESEYNANKSEIVTLLSMSPDLESFDSSTFSVSFGGIKSNIDLERACEIYQIQEVVGVLRKKLQDKIEEERQRKLKEEEDRLIREKEEAARLEQQKKEHEEWKKREAEIRKKEQEIADREAEIKRKEQEAKKKTEQERIAAEEAQEQAREKENATTHVGGDVGDMTPKEGEEVVVVGVEMDRVSLPTIAWRKVLHMIARFEGDETVDAEYAKQIYAEMVVQVGSGNKRQHER